MQSVVNNFAWYINKLLLVRLNQFQFDAVVSFAYDVGIDLDMETISDQFAQLTLLELINENASDALIRHEFMRHDKITVNGRRVVDAELALRRKHEADLYFTQVNGIHVDDIKY